MKTRINRIIFSFITLLLVIQPMYSQIVKEHNVTSQQNNTVTIAKNLSNPIKSFYANGAVKEIKNTLNGQLHGAWSFYYENGSIKKEGNFKNHRPHGTWKKYDTKGNLIRIENYKEGVEHGTWIEYHSNGLLKIKGKFINGKRTDEWSIYSYAGKKKYIYVFHDDIAIRTIDPEDNTLLQTSEIAGNL